MKVKQWFSYFAVLCSILLLAACGSNSGSGGDQSAGTGDQQVDEETGISYVGASTCIGCHQGFSWSDEEVANYLAGAHVIHSTHITAQSDSYCLGCHDPLGDGPALEAYVDGEFIPVEGLAAVGCETCHGPGGEHYGVGPIPVAEPTIEGACAQCHNNPDGHPGAIVDKVLNSNHARLGHNDTAKCQRCHTTEGAIEFASVTGDRDTMAALDSILPIDPEETTAPMCFACHDEHSGALRLPSEWNPIALDGESATSDQYKLCTSCHTYTDDDGNLVASGDDETTQPYYHNTAWYRTIASTHYDNPATGVTTTYSVDTASYLDVGLDADKTIEGYVIKTGDDKACFGCHSHDLTANTNLDEDDGEETTILTDWAQSAHAGGLLAAKYEKEAEIIAADGTVRTTAGTAEIMTVGAIDAEVGNAWAHYNWDRSGRKDCQHCHTATGASNFLDAVEEGTTYDSAANDFSHLLGWSDDTAYGSDQNELLYCWGCHSNIEEGELRTTAAIPLDYTVNGLAVSLTAPDENSAVCLSCHSGRGNMDTLLNGTTTATPSATTGYRTGGTSTHYLTAGAIINQSLTKIGYTYGLDYTDPDSYGHGHSTLGCANCHMESANSHSFEVVIKDEETEDILAIKSTACAACHTGQYSGGVPFVSQEHLGETVGVNAAFSETSVDTVITQEIIDAAGAILEEEAAGYHDALALFAAQLIAVDITPLPGYPYFSGTPANEGQSGAMHNYSLLHHEPGAYAHNRYYAKRLIFDSIDWLDNGVLDGTINIDAATYPEAAVWLGAATVADDTATPPVAIGDASRP